MTHLILKTSNLLSFSPKFITFQNGINHTISELNFNILGNKRYRIILFNLPIVFILLYFVGCKTVPSGDIQVIGLKPSIEPDYSDVIIPPNIAPLNFKINEEGNTFWVKATSVNGIQVTVRPSRDIVRFPKKSWRKLLADSKGGKLEVNIYTRNDEENWAKFNPLIIHIANEKIDPYLSYRFLYPGYEGWHKMSIVLRCLENFKEIPIIENQLVEHNCVNCHSFNRNDPEKFLIHIRGNLGGTYFVKGNKVNKVALKTKEMDYGAIYPSWHPKGRFVAFSSNKIVQNFHAVAEKNIEVYDLASSLVIYDTEKNEIFPCGGGDTIQYMETFPTWSPDGKFIYYCRTKKVGETFDTQEIKYDLAKRSFDHTTRKFGKSELVFNACTLNKSTSFPRISPNGKYLVFTLHDYGNFSIWHKEADLYLLNLQTKKAHIMDVNSNETESYHSWSSNSKWIVFSSKRGDGLTARPYIAYFGAENNVGKPFVLPQKDPTLYSRLLKTFNIPEFVTGKVKVDPHDIARAARDESVKTIWGGNK
jgi:hypothetical protein